MYNRYMSSGGHEADTYDIYGRRIQSDPPPKERSFLPTGRPPKDGGFAPLGNLFKGFPDILSKIGKDDIILVLLLLLLLTDGCDEWEIYIAIGLLIIWGF